MATDSTTLTIVLMKTASYSSGLEKEARFGAAWGTIKGIGNTLKGWRPKMPFRGTPRTTPPPLPPSWAASGNAQLAQARAAAPVAGSANPGLFTPGLYPRVRPSLRNTPIQGQYAKGTGWAGKWLDQKANAGWMGRAATMLPRKLLPGSWKNGLGTVGLFYGGSSAMANRNLAEEMKAVGNASAAEALIQQKEWAKEHYFKNIAAPFVSQETTAQHLFKKNQPLAQAYWMQSQNRDYLSDLTRQLTRNHGWAPWRSFWGGNRLTQPNSEFPSS